MRRVVQIQAYQPARKASGDHKPKRVSELPGKTQEPPVTSENQPGNGQQCSRTPHDEDIVSVVDSARRVRDALLEASPETPHADPASDRQDDRQQQDEAVINDRGVGNCHPLQPAAAGRGPIRSNMAGIRFIAAQ